MTEKIEPTTTPKKTRRTPAELKAHHLAQVKIQEDRERAEVQRLVADAHDTLASAAALEASKPYTATLNAALGPIKTVLSALTPKQ